MFFVDTINKYLVIMAATKDQSCERNLFTNLRCTCDYLPVVYFHQFWVISCLRFWRVNEEHNVRHNQVFGKHIKRRITRRKMFVGFGYVPRCLVDPISKHSIINKCV